jgi:hypothetical protein
MGFFKDEDSNSAGADKMYTPDSLAQLMALGGNLTQYTDTLESLKDYAPEKFDVDFKAETTTGSTITGGGSHTLKTYQSAWIHNDDMQSMLDAALPGLTSRLSGIQSKQDRPGRQQLLGNQSLLG